MSATTFVNPLRAEPNDDDEQGETFDDAEVDSGSSEEAEVDDGSSEDAGVDLGEPLPDEDGDGFQDGDAGFTSLQEPEKATVPFLLKCSNFIKGSVLDDDQSQGSNKSKKEIIEAQCKTLPCYIVHPESDFKLMWDFSQGMVLLYMYFELPYRTAFYETQVHWEHIPPDSSQRSNYYLNGSGDFLVFIDFLMSFFVGYYVDKKIHVARDDELAPEESILDGSADRVAHRQVVTRSASMTAKYYVFGPPEQKKFTPRLIFLVDAAACLPFDIILTWMGNPWLAAHWKMLRLLRISTVSNLKPLVFKILTILSEIWPGVLPVIELLMLLLMIVAFSHIVSCILYYAGHPGTPMASWPDLPCNLNDTCGWVTHEAWHQNTTTQGEKYVSSMYYSFTVLTTVGFGDILARGKAERVVSIFVMLLGTLVSGLLIGNVTNVVLASNLGKEAYRERFEQVMEFLEENNLSDSTQDRVRNFFRQMYVGERYYDEKEALGPLPDALKVEILHTIYDECLDAMPFMPDAQGTTRESVMEGGFDGISLRVRMALCEGIVQITYMSGDVVCSEGFTSSRMYVVMRGRFTAIKGKERVAKFGHNDIWGALSTIVEDKRDFTCVADVFSHLCTLDASVMKQVMNDFPTFRKSTLDWARAQQKKLLKDERSLDDDSFTRGNGEHPKDLKALEALAKMSDRWIDSDGDKFKKFTKFLSAAETDMKRQNTAVDAKIAASPHDPNIKDLRKHITQTMKRIDHHMLAQSHALLRMKQVQDMHKEKTATLNELVQNGKLR